MSLAELNPVASLRSRRRVRAVPPLPHPVVSEPRATRPVEGAANHLRERRYWIEHCQGFRVDGSHGRIGIVEDVRRPPNAAPVLVIRAGMLGRRVVEISASEVFEIVPRARRLWLRTPEAAGSRNVTTPEPLEAARAQAAA